MFATSYSDQDFAANKCRIFLGFNVRTVARGRPTIRVTRSPLCRSGTVSVHHLRTFPLEHFPRTSLIFSPRTFNPGQFPRTYSTFPVVYRSVCRIVLDDTLEPRNRGYWDQAGAETWRRVWGDGSFFADRDF